MRRVSDACVHVTRACVTCAMFQARARDCRDELSNADQQVTLNNGVVMPRVGFGTAGLGAVTDEAVRWALASGYRLLDSAQVQRLQPMRLFGHALSEENVFSGKSLSEPCIEELYEMESALALQAQEWYREDLVGLALLKSGVPREQVFLTSKLHPRCLPFLMTWALCLQKLA